MMAATHSSDAPSAGRFTLQRELPYERNAIDDAVRAVLHGAAARGYDETSCFAVRLALEEALSNAFKHGNREDPTKTVRLDCTIDQNVIELELEDQGGGFDPRAVPDPTAEENLEIPSGRGIVLMKSFMSDVEFYPPGNIVRMRYDRTRAPQAES